MYFVRWSNDECVMKTTTILFHILILSCKGISTLRPVTTTPTTTPFLRIPQHPAEILWVTPETKNRVLSFMQNPFRTELCLITFGTRASNIFSSFSRNRRWRRWWRRPIPCDLATLWGRATIPSFRCSFTKISASLFMTLERQKPTFFDSSESKFRSSFSWRMKTRMKGRVSTSQEPSCQILLVRNKSFFWQTPE